MLVGQYDKTKKRADLSIVRNKREEFTASNTAGMVLNLDNYDLILNIFDPEDTVKAPVFSKTGVKVTDYKGKITIAKTNDYDDYTSLPKQKYTYELVWRNKGDGSDILQQSGLFIVLDSD